MSKLKKIDDAKLLDVTDIEDKLRFADQITHLRFVEHNMQLPVDRRGDVAHVAPDALKTAAE